MPPPGCLVLQGSSLKGLTCPRTQKKAKENRQAVADCELPELPSLSSASVTFCLMPSLGLKIPFSIRLLTEDYLYNRAKTIEILQRWYRLPN